MKKEKNNKRRKLLKVLAIILCSYVVIGLGGGIIGYGATVNKKCDLEYKFYYSAWKKVRSDYPLMQNRTELTFKSGKRNLVGHLYEVENPLGVVVCMHGLGSESDSDNAEYQNYFIEQNFDVFAVDSEGCGKSEGRHAKGLYHSKYEAVAAVNFIKEYPSTKGLKVSLVGHSAGAYGAILASAECDVDNVLAMSSFDSPREVTWNMIKDKMGPFSFLLAPFIDLTMLFNGGKENYKKASDVIAAHPEKNYFLMHSTDDSFVNFQTASLIRKYNTPDFDYHKYEVFSNNEVPEYIPEYYEVKQTGNVYSQVITWSQHSDVWLSWDAMVYTRHSYWGVLMKEREEHNPDHLSKHDYVLRYGYDRIDKDKTSEMNSYAFSKVVELFK